MKNRKLQILKLILICFLIACSNSKNSTTISNENNQIVLIFNSPPSNWRVYNKAGGYQPTQCEIEFMADNFMPRLFVPNPELEFDTLLVNTKRKFIEFRHSYKAIDRLSYIFQKGDTVLFTYQDKTPIAEVLNRNTKSYDINFDLYKRERFNSDDYPAYIKLLQPFLFRENTKGFKQMDEFKNEVERVKAIAIEQFALELNLEKKLLDSLQQNNLISEEIYYFFATQSNYQKKYIELHTLLKPQSGESKLTSLKPDNFNIQLGFNNELGWMNSGNILDSKNDSLLYFSFHNSIINLIYYNYLSGKVRRIETTNYVNNIATAGSILPDYLALYDTINESTLLSPLAKKMLNFRNIQSTIEENSINESKQAFKKFKNDVRDTSMINFIRNKYMLPSDSLVNNFDLALISTDSLRLNFNELIEKHRGSVLYVDFWSSGCPPCIAQFKFSDSLHNLYKGKNLVQIYISPEPDKKWWLQTSKKYNLDPESYFVENRYTSQQLENMNIKFVPHYLIYDRKGNLVNDFAPRPSEKSLIQILDKYINE